MTFYYFDHSNFPEVKLIFTKEIDSKYINNFFDEWLKIYDYKQPFYVIYDTSLLSTAPLNFVRKLLRFIKKIKKKDPQYLTKSILIVYDTTFARCLLNTAMAFTSPTSDLYIYWKKDNNTIINVDNVITNLEKTPAIFQHIKSY